MAGKSSTADAAGAPGRVEDQQSNTGNRVGVYAFLLTLAVFLLDLATGRGYAEGILYVAPVLLSLWTKNLRVTQVLAFACPLLVIVGYFFSDRSMAAQVTHWLPLSNRLYAFSIVGAAGMIVWQRKRSLTGAQQAREELDSRIQSRLLQSLMRAISTSTDLESAMERALVNICETIGWDYGEAWIPQDEQGVLERCPGSYAASQRLEPFTRASSRLTFPPNEGLPGLVWVTKEPVWFLNVSLEPLEHFSRADAAAQVGLKGGFAVPIIADGDVLSVLCFFMMSEPREEDLALVIDLVHSVASQLGSVVQRTKIDAQLQQANHELRRKNQEMEEFVHTVSHDLKSPLVTIGGMFGMLKEELQEGRLVDVSEIIAAGEDTVARMQDLIDDLLKLSRIGRVEQDLKPLELKPLIERILRTYALVVENNGVIVEFDLDAPTVVADANRLAEVLENLIANALKYGCGGPQPRIAIGSRTADGETRLFVKDQGPGIDQQQHERVFDLFQQLDQSQQGTGVGLAIVRRIMGAHHGRAWVESSLGEGATFWLAFPDGVAEVALTR